MLNNPLGNRPRSDHPQQRNSHDAAAWATHLRLHQPQEAPVDGTADVITQHGERQELAQVVGKAACRLRQHVASATMHCGMLARRLGNDSHNTAILNEIVESVKSLETLVDGLSDYAADQPPHCESVALKRLVDEVLETLKPRLTRQRVTVDVNVPSGMTLDADRRMMATAMRHLAHSALAGMPGGGQLVITAVSSRLGLELEVADSGPGLTEDELPRAFAATQHSAVGASGLERAIAQHVVSAHGGQISARNCPEGGAAFTLLFPSRRAQKAA